MSTVSVDPRALIAVMNGMDSQLPFAAMKALNECANYFQRDERKLMQSSFTIRRPWVLTGVKIDRGDFATKQNLKVRIHIDGKQDFLAKFEEGGIRTALSGGSLSVPIAARTSPTAVVSAALRPKALQFTGSGKVLKGQRDTFLIRGPNGGGVILQRLARKAAVKKRHHGPFQKGERHDYAVKVLYVLKQQTPVPASLHFEETAHQSFATNWPTAFEKWWNHAVATANYIQTGAGGSAPTLPP